MPVRALKNVSQCRTKKEDGVSRGRKATSIVRQNKSAIIVEILSRNKNELQNAYIVS